MHSSIPEPLLFAAVLLATVFVFVFGRGLIRFFFRPLRRFFVFIWRRIVAPIYRWTLRPIVRLGRRSLGIAVAATESAKRGTPTALGAAPYKALVNLLEKNSLAEDALGDVPREVRNLLDRKGIFFRAVNANRAVGGIHDSLSVDEARANVGLAAKYYAKSIDDSQHQVGPTFLYEDAEEALVIEILRDSDVVFFWVLRRIKRNVSRNIVKIIVFMTALVATFPFVTVTVVGNPDFAPKQTFADLLIYSIILIGYVLALSLLRNAYANSARYNGQNFNHFVQSYFSRLLNQYKSASASFSNVLNDRTDDLDAVERVSGMWFVNLHWISARQWLLELYVRNTLFQIRRDLLWFLLTIPAGMAALWFAVIYLLNVVAALSSEHLGIAFPHLIFKFDSSLWIVVPFVGMIGGYLYALWGLLDRFSYELSSDTWATFRAMDIKQAIERNIGSTVREVVSKRRNPFGQQPSPIGPSAG